MSQVDSNKCSGLSSVIILNHLDMGKDIKSRGYPEILLDCFIVEVIVLNLKVICLKGDTTEHRPQLRKGHGQLYSI